MDANQSSRTHVRTRLSATLLGILGFMVATGISGLAIANEPMSDIVGEALDTHPLAQPPNYQFRQHGEWQGMLVDRNVKQMCGNSNHCGNALACILGTCSPCTEDSHCGKKGVVCVLDHCVQEENVRCRTRSDCASESMRADSSDALCILSGYSAEVRGNEDMEAYCVDADGGTPQVQTDFESLRDHLDSVTTSFPSPIDSGAMMEEVEEYWVHQQVDPSRN